MILPLYISFLRGNIWLSFKLLFLIEAIRTFISGNFTLTGFYSNLHVYLLALILHMHNCIQTHTKKVCMQVSFAFDDLCGQKENNIHKQHLCVQLKSLSLLSFKFLSKKTFCKWKEDRTESLYKRWVFVFSLESLHSLILGVPIFCNFCPR